MGKSSIIFIVSAIVYQIAVMILYGLLIGYENVIANVSFTDSSIFAMATVMLILLIVGFGLMASYISSASINGIVYTLLIFALTFQSFFLCRALWLKAGAFDTSSVSLFRDPSPLNYVTVANFGQDRQQVRTPTTGSVVDAIACAIANYVAFTSVVGRIGLGQIFYLTTLGTFFYTVNDALMWRFFVTDVGFGIRIFIYGSFMAIVSAFITIKEHTKDHYRYSSTYQTQSLSLLGVIFVWLAWPLLTASNLYTSQNDLKIIYPAVCNMWLALAAGVIGSFTASCIYYYKCHVYDIIFSAITGGIAFSSSADLNFNPAVPLCCGYIIGFVSSFLNQKLGRYANRNGVVFSLSMIQHFVIPGLAAGFLSAILQALGTSQYNNSIINADPSRSQIGQGAIQLLGMAISAGIGILAGILIGLSYRLINEKDRSQDYFDDSKHFQLEDITREQTIRYQENTCK